MRTTHSKKLVTVGLLALTVVVCFIPAVIASESGYGPGRVELSILAGRDHVDIGSGGVWNSVDKLHIQLEPLGGWRIKEYHIDQGGEADYSPPLTPTGNPKIGHFDYKEIFDFPYQNNTNEDGHQTRRTFTLDLEADMGFMWGTPYAELRTQGLAIFLDLVKLDAEGNEIAHTGAWAVPKLVTWIVEDPVEDEVVVIGDDIVANAETGELIDPDARRIERTSKGVVATNEHQAAQQNWDVDEAEEIVEFEGGRWGWWFTYTMGHPMKGQFVDSPVAGLTVETPTYEGVTDETASFAYFPGEKVDVSLGSILLGSAFADKKISPLDIFDPADTDDPRVINMARLLQSLDDDGEAKGTINITEPVVGAFEQAMGQLGLTSIDFVNYQTVETIIQQTITNAAMLDPPVFLTAIPADEARGHLEDTLGNSMFRKRVSRTPEMESAKAKMNISTVWQPALPAYASEGTRVAPITYFDEEGRVIATAEQAKPIVVVFTDKLPETGQHDVWAGVSRDDGATWKRKNLSRMADRSSFELENGMPVFGHCKKPVFHVKSNKIVVAWSSKYARGGKPRFAIDVYDDYPYDDPYAVDDVWGVAGQQRSFNYIEEGHPEVGEVPHSALWVCRGVIATQADVDKGVGQFPGDIVWFKPERLTSGRRDVNQIFISGASGAGFGVVWQEDPEGVRPGEATGPGEGWSGAIASHKTDIWYSYISWGDHSKIDTNYLPGGDPEHELDVVTRPKALVPMALPVRLSDNDVLNTKNMGMDTSTDAEEVAYSPENLTRCVKFEGGKSIVPADHEDAATADYSVLRRPPEDHSANMNCVNCHVPFGMEPHENDTPTQGAPIPVVVVDAENLDYLGGFTRGDCVSCHYSYIVPRDRVIAVTPGLDEAAKCAECETKGGIWKDGTQEGGEILEAYYPYDGFPYIFDEDGINDGSHRYGQAVDGLLSGYYYTFINNSGKERSVAITSDGRLLNGDTGATRPNIMMQPYTNAQGKTSAWAMITYEETKGVGAGVPTQHHDDPYSGDPELDKYKSDEGKNVIYHSFDFKNPDKVSSGHIMNPPELDEFGNPVYLVDKYGDLVLDWNGLPMLAYENARRARFIIQGRGAIKSSRTIMGMVYKMGPEGKGRPSDIFLRRWVVPTTDDPTVDNPYRFENVVGEHLFDPVSATSYWRSGYQNLSSVTPVEVTESSGDPESDDPWGAVKIIRWTQTADNLNDKSYTNGFEEARAHRGQLRGDFMTVGFTYCDNWGASRNGNDKYDFFVRRSFDGGQTWTTDPNGVGVEHGNTWTYPSGTDSSGTQVEEVNYYAPGEFEAMRNLSQMKNNKESVIEPRLVAVPGTIKSGGVWTGIPEDKQNPNVFYVTYGTETNPKKDPVTGEQDLSVPVDLFYSFSRDKGETYHLEPWVVNPDSEGNNAGETVYRWGTLARGDAQQGEAQVRMTPDGSRFYACWLDDGPEGSDIVFRRIMSAQFPQNNGVDEPDADPEPIPVIDTKTQLFEITDSPARVRR